MRSKCWQDLHGLQVSFLPEKPHTKVKKLFGLHQRHLESTVKLYRTYIFCTTTWTREEKCAFLRDELHLAISLCVWSTGKRWRNPSWALRERNIKKRKNSNFMTQDGISHNWPFLTFKRASAPRLVPASSSVAFAKSWNRNLCTMHFK